MLPRLNIKHTSEEGYGQIYVGAVNWCLLFATVGLTLFFRSPITWPPHTDRRLPHDADDFLLLFIAMREVWKWSLAASAALAGSSCA